MALLAEINEQILLRQQMQTLLAFDPSCHRRVGQEEVRRLLDADFLGDRAESVPERFNRFLGFEDVEHAEAVRPLSGCVDEKTLERQVRR